MMLNSFPGMISIHSAARAETKAEESVRKASRDFNPLRREGGDGLYPYVRTIL